MRAARASFPDEARAAIHLQEVQGTGERANVRADAGRRHLLPLRVLRGEKPGGLDRSQHQPARTAAGKALAALVSCGRARSPARIAQLFKAYFQILRVEEDVQRAGACDAGRKLAEEKPRVVLDLLQLLEKLGIPRQREHARTLAKRGAGRSGGGRKAASRIHDTGEVALFAPCLRNRALSPIP